MEKIENSIVTIVSYDAGGAELLSWWVKNNNQNKFYYFIKGPAKKIFLKNKIKLTNTTNLKKSILKSNYLFTSTSLKNNHELNAIKLAKKFSIKSFSFIDHWINYKERFLRKNKLILPDNIVVTDIYAYRISKKIFKNVKIFLQENFFLKQLSKKKKLKKKNIILFLSSNNNLNLKKNFVSDEEIIKRLIHKLNITFPKIKTLTIRLHPTEKKKKYRFLGKKYNNLNITFDNNQNILDTLIRSKLVIGFDSMGIVIANSMKIKSYNLDLQNINEKNVIPRKYYFDKLKI